MSTDARETAAAETDVLPEAHVELREAVTVNLPGAMRPVVAEPVARLRPRFCTVAWLRCSRENLRTRTVLERRSP